MDLAYRYIGQWQLGVKCITHLALRLQEPRNLHEHAFARG